MPRGFFVTLEGLDGSGKSTQLNLLTSALLRKGIQPTVTRQPGGTPFGDSLRKLVLDSKSHNLSTHAELAMMFADRAQAISEVIEPALSAGQMVLCDRFTDSTEAYQGGGRQLGSDIVLDMHRLICGNLQPDLTILLLPPLENSLRRARNRNARLKSQGKDENRFEQENLAFFRRVFDKYAEIARREPVRVVEIDEDSAIDAVHARILSLVEERYHAHLGG